MASTGTSQHNHRIGLPCQFERAPLVARDAINRTHLLRGA